MGRWLLVSMLLGGCVVERIPLKEGVGSFRVELVEVEPFAKLPPCEAAPDTGTQPCPRPFPTIAMPARVTIQATALDRAGEVMGGYAGQALVDVRPGRFANVGPAGLVMDFANGVGQRAVEVAYSFGEVRVWVEDCGSGASPGTFATGASPPLFFDAPTLTDLNITDDNTTSPMIPRADNICALGGDRRYGLGVDQNGSPAFVGFSYRDGEQINSPPPAIGTYVRVRGCSRQEFLAGGVQGCSRGPLVVTGVANEGFYMTDLHPDAVAAGFNHIYAFTFNYPDNLQTGDVLTELAGGPVEFTGTTQISNPSWRKDEDTDLTEIAVPPPVHITPEMYESVLFDFGSNNRDAMALETLEGALVCFDNIAPPSELVHCDVNRDGRIDRSVCRVSQSRPLPKRCDEDPGKTSEVRRCDDDWISANYCFDLSAETYERCGLQFEDQHGTLRSAGRIPYSEEYCCERACYDDPACTEESSMILFGQWSADVRGRYERSPDDPAPVKVAFATRDANPDFEPTAFGALERQKPPGERRRLRIIGNLRHVLAARPVWLVVARSPADITVDESCP